MDPGEAEVEAAQIQARTELYSTYVQWTERLVDRRAEANKFYVTLNTAIVGAIGFLFSSHFATEAGGALGQASLLAAALAFAGVLTSWNWRNVIKSQRTIMGWKFGVIHKLEEALPYQPYKDEWAAATTGKKAPRIGRFEQRLPSLFMLFFVVVLAIAAGYALGLDDWIASRIG